MIFICLTILFVIIFLIQKNSIANNADSKLEKGNIINKANQKTKEKVNMKKNINVIINGVSFSATLEENESTKKFVEMLPLEIDMKELNNNEKYYYLSKSLPTNSYNPNNINTGDIMLYGNNCLVLFYESFKTSYSYTKLGSIDNPDALKEILGEDSVIVRFEKNE